MATRPARPNPASARASRPADFREPPAAAAPAIGGTARTARSRRRPRLGTIRPPPRSPFVRPQPEPPLTATAPPPSSRPPAVRPRAFPVHRVPPAGEPAETGPPLDVLGARDDAPRPTACSRLAAPLVADPHPHALAGAVHRAFAEHRPLVLSPDMLWTAVVQGVARHVRNHAEEMRPLFVSHDGRKTLSVEAFSDAPASPEFPWAETVGGFAGEVVREVGGAAEALRVDFSTTGPTERIARDVAVLDAFEPYFTYEVRCICGIPAITLEGTPADWDRLRTALDGLDVFGMDWWTVRLREIADRFAAASRGEVDAAWWRAIYKRKEVYGGFTFSGWFAWLFPYVGPAGEVRNPVLDDPTGGTQIGSGAMPPGLSEVPVTVVRLDGSREPFDLLAGFLGIEPAGGDGCGLRPVLGWAVRRSHGDTVVYRRFREAAIAPPISLEERDRQIARLKAEAEALASSWAENSPHVDFDGWCVIEGCPPAFAAPLLGVGDGFFLRGAGGSADVLVKPVREWSCVATAPSPLSPGVRELYAAEGLTDRSSLKICFGELSDGRKLLGEPHAIQVRVEVETPSGGLLRLDHPVLPGLLALAAGTADLFADECPVTGERKVQRL